MEPIEVKFLKTHDNAKLPTRNHGNIILDEGTRMQREIPGTCDSGYDIYCCVDEIIPARSAKEIETGITVASITPGYWFRIEARSGLGFKHKLFPHFGIIDNPYRGRTSILIYNNSDVDYKVTKGDRIAQMVLYPVIDFTVDWADEIEATHRGSKNLGSSGK